MSRETIDSKAHCYLVEGRLSIEHADVETVQASRASVSAAMASAVNAHVRLKDDD